MNYTQTFSDEEEIDLTQSASGSDQENADDDNDNEVISQRKRFTVRLIFLLGRRGLKNKLLHWQILNGKSMDAYRRTSSWLSR